MVERRRQQPRNQPSHGSNFRGARAVPRTNWEASRLQSEQAQSLLRERFLQGRRETKKAEQIEEGFGNRGLPAYKHKQEITDVVENYKAVILGGETGSGKSTQVPQFLYEAGYDKTFVLVPRRVIADGLHDRLVQEMSEKLGDVAAHTVGVLHGDRAEIHEDNKIVVMTPNTFLLMEKSLREEFGDKKVAILADEIHEANLFTEVATGVAAQAVSQQDSWRLVAMSATHNASALMDSFTTLNDNGEVPTIHIEGRQFDMEIDERPEQTMTDVYAEVGSDHVKTMIFTSGKNEIKHIIDQIVKRLEEEERGSSSKVEFRMLHGDLSRTERQRIKEPVSQDKRLVIVSSPAGMSGITIPGVTCVISDGTINRPELDDDEVSGLRRSYLSHAEIVQQMGRAGRDIAGGVGYLAKPTAVYEDKLREEGKDEDKIPKGMPYVSLAKRERFGPPEIYHTHLGQVALTIAALNRQFTEINEFLPHQVEQSSILKAQEGLYRIGALQARDDGIFEVTSTGLKMNKFAVRPELSRGMVEAMDKGRTQLQLARTALIIAAVEAGGLQDYNKDTMGDGWKEFLRESTIDDMMAQYDIMAALPFTHEGDIDEQFVKDHNLSYKHLERSLKVARKIFKELGIHRHNIALTPPNSIEEAELHEDLTAGFIDSVYQKAGYYDERQWYRNIHGDTHSTQRYISGRSLMHKAQPEYIAGIPRWFLKGPAKHNVVELTMPVDPEIVARYAIVNGILEREIVGSKIVDNNAVVEQYQPKFGSIIVGKLQDGSFAELIPQESQEALVQHVLTNQGQAQKVLREVADEYERYRLRVPADELRRRTKIRSGAPITAKKIERLIREAARTKRLASDIDHVLRSFIYQANIGIERYFTIESRDELKAMSPDTYTIGDRFNAKLQYDSPEVPYITMPQTEEGRRLVRGSTMQLPDGREVFVKRANGSGESDFVSASQI